MPYELYWRGPLNAIFIYAEKARIERERENSLAWLNGIYIKRAVVSAFNKDAPYPTEPIKAQPKITPEQERKNQEISEMIKEHNLLINAQLEANTHG